MSPPSAADIIPADWAHWSRSAPRLVRPLTSGLTNRSYLIAADKIQLVLRINSPISNQLDLDRAAEAQALQLADRAGLCAPVIYCDPQHRYLVTRFVTGIPLDSTATGALAKLAQLLGRIHQLPTIAAELNIEQKIASYWRSVERDDPLFNPLTALQQKVLPHITAADALSSGNVLCHNDLLQNNLIDSSDGRLYAIDWEYAASGDPFYDLAVIAEGHDLDHSARHNLLAAYLQSPVTNADEQRLHHWQIIYRYIAVLWYTVQAVNHSTSAFATSRKEILAEIDDQLRRIP